MFLLRTAFLPPTIEAFRDLLERSLRELVQENNAPQVFVEGRDYPCLSAIRIDLSGSVVTDRLPVPHQLPQAKAQSALEADHLEICASPMRIQGAPVQFHCRAEKVKFGEAVDDSGDLMLLLQQADSGKLELAVAMSDLEQLVRTLVTPLARKQSIVLEDLRLRLTSENERSLRVELKVRVRKLFLNTQVHLTGNLEIDDELNARLSSLDCAGDGTLGTLACGFLFPHLKRLEEREFSLLNLPFGEVKLRDVRIAIGDQLQVKAEFGTESGTSLGTNR